MVARDPERQAIHSLVALMHQAFEEIFVQLNWLGWFHLYWLRWFRWPLLVLVLCSCICSLLGEFPLALGGAVRPVARQCISFFPALAAPVV